MYYNNLGLTLTVEGRLTEALSACEKAVRLPPNLPEAHCNFGNALNGLGQSDKAPAAYDCQSAYKVMWNRFLSTSSCAPTIA
jgi:Flp pilus assembly protein TadD